MDDSGSRYGGSRIQLPTERIAEIERKLESVWARESNRSHGPRYLVRYNGSRNGRSYVDVNEVEVERSATHSKARSGISGRTPTEVSRHSSRRDAAPQPLAIMAGPANSSTSRSSHKSERARDENSSSRSYVSARSSTSTVKPKSKSGSVARSEHSRREKSSIVSARLVPLPESVVGSVLPSDSVSCAGSRRERESDYERMSERERLRNRF